MVRFIGWLAAVGLLAGASPAKAEFLVGLTTTGQIVTFDSATPGTLATTATVVGTSGGLVGIDYRPTNGLLYGATASALYTINPTTGAAALVGNLTSGGALVVFAPGTQFGFDFNPEADRLGNSSLRFIGSDGSNSAVNANTAVLTPQTGITGGAVTSSAYTNNDVDPATGTTLYGISAGTNTLLTTAAPAGGAYTTVGSLGVTATAAGGFDISGRTGTAYAVFGSTLYTINLGTGAATSAGTIGGGFTFTGIAALPAGPLAVPTPVPPTLLAALAAPALLAFARRRRAAPAA